MKTDIIENCPFCGSDKVICTSDWILGDRPSFYCRCLKCEAKGNQVDVPDEDYHSYNDLNYKGKAIENWNRVSLAVQDKKI